MKILVTGGAGFIGSNLVRLLVTTTEHSVLNVDALTYAGNKRSLSDLEGNPRAEACGRLVGLDGERKEGVQDHQLLLFIFAARAASSSSISVKN